MAVTTREELKSYCLRKLGEPVIKVNVANEQVEDRIDEALQFFKEMHILGSEKSYYIHVITQQDIDNKYINVNDISNKIISINKLVEVEDNSTSFMSNVYQYKLSIYDNVLTSKNAIDYYLGMSHLNLINRLFESGKVIEFNKNTNKLKIYVDWSEKFKAGESKIAFECFEYIDEITNADVYDDIFLKNLTTQLIKLQWGENLKKMKGMKLAGGIELDGQGIWDEANEAIKEIKDNASDYPLGLYIG